MIMTTQLSLRRRGLIAAVAASLCVAFAAGAQDGVGSRGFRWDRDESFVPTVTEYELKHFSNVLNLDETQTIIAREMFARFGDQFREEAESLKEEIEEISEEARATGNWRLYSNELDPLLAKWNIRKKELESKLIDDLKSLLYEHQADRWPVLLREKRRRDSLPNARLGGEDVDLIRLVNDLDLDEPTLANLRGVLEQYAVELDIALQARDKAIDSLQEKWSQAMRSNREQVAEIWRDATRRRAVVRDINRRYVQMILPQLDNETARHLEGAWQRAAYPLAYEETQASRMLEAVRGLESLDEAQIASIESIAADYEFRLDSLRRRLIAAIVKDEEELPRFIRNIQVPGRRSGRRQISVIMAAGEDEPYDGLLKERREISGTVVNQIQATLGPEQRERLPDIEEDRGSDRAVIFRGRRFNL